MALGAETNAYMFIDTVCNGPMYPQGVCRIRKPAYAGNDCAIFPVFDTEEWTEKIRSQPKAI